MNAREQRQRRWDIGKGQVMTERLQIQFPLDIRILEQRFDFGSEQQLAACHAVIEGLFAHVVAGQQQSAAGFIPETESEHAVQLRHAIRPQVFIEVDDVFGVGVGPVPLAMNQEPLLQALVIVDFAVERDPDSAVFVGHRLVTGHTEIHDAEAAVDQDYPMIGALITPRRIGSPVDHHVTNTAQIR